MLVCSLAPPHSSSFVVRKNMLRPWLPMGSQVAMNLHSRQSTVRRLEHMQHPVVVEQMRSIRSLAFLEIEACTARRVP